MIVNSYGVLLALVDLIRLGLGLTALWVGLTGRRAWAGPTGPEDRTAAEDRLYLTFLLVLVLIGLNLVSWPLLYLLLQSYVAEWPGVMCIYGVTRVGIGSLGPSRYLPGLLSFLELIKPATVFLGGAWFVLYLVNRRTQTAPLLPRLIWWLLPVGALAFADATAELTYLGIPKKETLPPVGCCTVDDDPGRFLPTGFTGPRGREWLTAGFIVGNVGLLAGLAAAARRPGSPRLVPLVAWGLGAAAVSAVFLVEVAAPKLLGLPDHRCAYDLIPRVPEAMAPVALYVAGGFCLGWAAVAHWGGRGAEVDGLRPAFVGRLLRLSLWANLVALAMLAMEWALA